MYMYICIYIHIYIYVYVYVYGMEEMSVVDLKVKQRAYTWAYMCSVDQGTLWDVDTIVDAEFDKNLGICMLIVCIKLN